MTQDGGLELPEHVAAKIEEVLGVLPSELDGYDLVKLIEELCDTALMFDREQRGAGGVKPGGGAGASAIPPKPTGSP